MSETTNEHAPLKRLAAALSGGLFLVDSNGEVLCVVQEATKDRASGDGSIGAIEAFIVDPSSLGQTNVPKLDGFRQGPNGDGVSANLDSLTQRELDVLGLICEGRSDEHMSRFLGLSRYTVRNHIAALYRKIGVNRRSAAIIWARERGITDGDGLKSPGRKRRLWKRNGGGPFRH